MRLFRVGAAIAALVMGMAADVFVVQAASTFSLRSDGSVEIGNRTLRCKNARSRLDDRLPNLGLSIPDARLLILNPALLRRQPETVRMFVFQHECGHHHVGASELGADCWAVKRGVAEGWLNRPGLGQVCRSFGNARATSTHPSAARRCANLDRCYATATADLARQKRVAQSRSTTTSSSPQLVSGPRLIRTGAVR